MPKPQLIETVYDLSLFVAGSSPRSREAIRSIMEICAVGLKGHCHLDIIDIYQRPELAKKNQIVAVPTLIRRSPGPLRKLVGDMTDKQRVFAGLEITL